MTSSTSRPTEYKTVQAGPLLHHLMTAQIRVHDLDLDEILQQLVAEIGEGTFQPSVVGNGRDRSLLGCRGKKMAKAASNI